MNKNYLPPKTASKILEVHWMTLRNWSGKDKIDTIRTVGGKRYYNVAKNRCVSLVDSIPTVCIK